MAFVWKGLGCAGSPFCKAVTAGEKNSQERQPVHFLIKLQMTGDDKCSGKWYLNFVKVLIVQCGGEQVAKCVFGYTI